MPLVRVDLIEGKPADFRQAVGNIIYQQLVEMLKVPADDRFQVIAEHKAQNFIFDPSYLAISRTADCIFIQITLNEGRALEVKQAFYKALADTLDSQLGVRREDVFINLVEVPKVNWSFGNGEAQYAPRGPVSTS